MISLRSILIVTVWIFYTAGAVVAQDHMKDMDVPLQQMEKMPAKSALQPAEGAAVKIISPKPGAVVKGDKVPLQFKLTNGMRGEHVHAYGEMMGTFKTEKGALKVSNGSAQHTLELRVTTAEHNTELNATDTVSFTTK